MESSPTIRIEQIRDYAFTIDFGETLAPLLTDESVPIGRGEGPCPEQLLIAGVTNCLCASLVFAFGKYRQETRGLVAEARARIERNPDGRLRIAGIEVSITLGSAAVDLPRLDRVLAQFEAFCTVSESVKAGIPVAVELRDGAGIRLN